MPRKFAGARYSQQCRTFRRSVDSARRGRFGKRVIIVEEHGLAGRRRLTNDLIAIAEWKPGGAHAASGRHDIIEQTDARRLSEADIGWHVVKLRRSRRRFDALGPNRDARQPTSFNQYAIRRNDSVKQAHG
jgi:hypothetical protein